MACFSTCLIQERPLLGSGRRLRILRAAFGINGFGTNQLTFAQQLGLTKSNYNNYENGFPIPRENALMIANKLGGRINVAWLYSGEEKFLSLETVRLLAAIETQLSASPGRRSKRKSSAISAR